MYLVDSSVWIDFFRKEQTPTSNALQKIILSESKVGIDSHIYLEVLQGIGEYQAFIKIKESLKLHAFYALKDSQESYAQAALIYSNCRKQGITLRSTIDCLIVQCAIENNLILLHNDRDFESIAKIYPLLIQEKI